ncbi:MAG TPA: DmsC/YnfH family molybdoenzyme membrane anchor subunit [Anaerolineales bacterium]|nr:DmsC/YnfH family molybdoenzyme membrane anchor subunit [Anaerolineales bacterium]
MNVREWALVLFTILAQMSVGSFIGLGIVHFFAQKKAGQEEADRFSSRALLAIWPVMALGFLASILHLGNPLNAYRAVTNLGTSWLSREILFGVLFAVLGFAFAILQWRKIGSFVMRNIVAWLAAIVGVVFVFSMGQVYMLPTQPAWNTMATPISFFTTTLLLGALALGVAFVINYSIVLRKNPDCEEAQCELLHLSLRWISIVTVILLGVELIMIPIYIAALSATGSAVALTSTSMMIGEFGVVFAARLVLVFIGAGIFGVLLYKNAESPGKENALANYAYGAFVLVLVAEVLGRFLFYATQAQITL